MNKRAHISARQRGVSLVEILIVLMIAAMVAGTVVVNMPPLRNGAQEESDRFAARLSLAAEQAVTRGELLGLKVGEDGYSFYRYERGEWKPLTHGVAGREAFPADVSVTVTAAEAAKKNEEAEPRKETEESPRPTIFFAPTGETTPFEIAFQEKRSVMRVTLDNAGKVEVIKDAGAQ